MKEQSRSPFTLDILCSFRKGHSERGACRYASRVDHGGAAGAIPKSLKQDIRLFSIHIFPFYGIGKFSAYLLSRSQRDGNRQLLLTPVQGRGSKIGGGGSDLRPKCCV
jgi:hypothetical protein